MFNNPRNLGNVYFGDAEPLAIKTLKKFDEKSILSDFH
jgi:hypothetical protein